MSDDLKREVIDVSKYIVRGIETKVYFSVDDFKPYIKYGGLLYDLEFLSNM